MLYRGKARMNMIFVVLFYTPQKIEGAMKKTESLQGGYAETQKENYRVSNAKFRNEKIINQHSKQFCKDKQEKLVLWTKKS